MEDALLTCIRDELPIEIRHLVIDHLEKIVFGRFEELLSLPLVRLLLGHEDNNNISHAQFENFSDWNDFVFERLVILLATRTEPAAENEELPSYRQHFFLLIAIASLQAFLQSNVTGPPLPSSSANLIFPKSISSDHCRVDVIRKRLVNALSVDGEAAYRLTPNIELLCLAETILTSPAIKKNVKYAQWVKLRIDFIHQRLLPEVSPTLQTAISEGLNHVNALLRTQPPYDKSETVYSYFLLEQAAVNTYYGYDKKAREAIALASKTRKFDFALTGLLGKRTRWQDKDISQLVVLARSYDRSSDDENEPSCFRKDHSSNAQDHSSTQPQTLNLNDDTLLESISYACRATGTGQYVDQSALPSTLASLDPAHQPLLHPIDAALLLSLASSITNTSPADGLTREETLPYAARVLEGGSSNWQVYTQALLVRSRIEGYKSRTVERGLLQLQALVDQVIAETSLTEANTNDSVPNGNTNTFLPRPKESEAAPVHERLRYVYALSSPSRWELEGELAARWVSLGGLRSALDIYQRLEMWAEAALCYAATDREGDARRIVQRQLFHATNQADEMADTDNEKCEGIARDPPPADAPRLYCILGDLNKDVTMYEKAWNISERRYARAQRSLGRHYFCTKEFGRSAAAYEKALKINQLNQSSWFALGCALLELSEFERAAEAFSRTVQLDDTDAEAWSNLAAALLRKGSSTPTSNGDTSIVQRTYGNNTRPNDDDGETENPLPARRDPQKHKRDALKALKRAASLKYDNFRIWDNLLTVAASLVPPAYSDIVTAQKRIIEMRGPSAGEQCIDVNILENLVRHVVTTSDGYDASKPGLSRLVVDMVDKHVVPLITSSPRLWHVVAKLALWRGRPGSALDCHEKAWRAVISQVGREAGTEAQWGEVVQATIDLVDAYESLGGVERTEGLGGGSGELVARDWKFKARSALRTVMGKGKSAWEDSTGWLRLRERMESLRG